MPTIKYFSAEHVEKTFNGRPARLRIRNRAAPRNYIDHNWSAEACQNLEAQLKRHFNSPILRCEILWFDETLELLFYRTIQNDTI